MTTTPVGYPRPRHDPAPAATPSTVYSELPVLRLPLPGVSFAPDERCSRCRPRRVPAQARRGVSNRVAAHVRDWPRRSSDEGPLAWLRWLLGHHLAVGVWRLQRELLASALDPATRRCDAMEAMHAVAAMYHTYSALLLYSGSCRPEVYANVIRTQMMARHPAFSGTWARDHEHVSALLGKLKPLTDETVKGSLRFNRMVHISVAKRLVPAGKSLLRESGGHPASTTDADRDNFDEFFRISRDDVCRHSFAAQLTNRIRMAQDDIGENPVVTDYGNDELHRLQAGISAQLAALSSTVSEWKGTRS